jgi:hypothetical protein
MSKELNVIQASNMPEGTKFKVKFPSGRFEEENIKLCGELFEWCDSSGTTMYKDLVNSTFIPIQQPVSFMEVLEGLSKCNINNEIVKGVYEKLRENNNAHEFYKREIIKGLLNGEFYYIHDIIYALSGCMSCSNWKNIIKEGKWYIEESEEE